MKVLLVQALTTIGMERVYPLGLAWLAACLPDHDVRIFDLNLHPEDPLAALEREVRQVAPDVVGLSLRNIKVASPGHHDDELEPQRLAARVVRRAAPDALLVAGGTALSLYAEPVMRRIPEIDLGIWGEAEERLPRLLEAPHRPEDVPGLWYRRDGELRWSGDPPPVDVAALPRPRRDLVPVAPYAASSFTSVGVQTKRGCALRCIHCSDNWLLGHRIRTRPPAAVVDEVQELVEDHGVRQLFFCDTVFNIPPDHALAICREIVDRGLELRWTAWFNEHRHALTEELVAAAAESGCGLLSFSPDHVTDRMLRNLGKNVTRADLERTWDLARRHDLDVEYSFFLNAPGETPASMMAILAFLARARWHLGPRLRLFTLLMAQPIRIYPHSRIAEMAREAGLVGPEEELVEPRFWNPGTLSMAVAAFQVGAASAWRIRRAVRRARGERPASL